MDRPVTILAFYRVVKTDPPSLLDFISPEALGRTLSDPTPERQRLWSGLSVYDTEARARKKARRVPLLGTDIAKIEIHAVGAIRVERTTTSTAHYTLWGDPDDVYQRVIAIVPVEETENQDVV